MKKILLIDDTASFLEVARGLLESEGWQVDCLTDLKKVIETVIFFEPDLVMIDLNMPQMQGDAVVGIIRAKFPGVKIIIWSEVDAFGEAIYQREFLGKCDRFLNKGAEPEKNLNVIKELLGE